MSDSDNPTEPDMIASIKSRMLQPIVTRMEGTLNPNSADDMRMFDELFDELLQEENIVLSQAERKRLYNELLSSF